MRNTLDDSSQQAGTHIVSGNGFSSRRDRFVHPLFDVGLFHFAFCLLIRFRSFNEFPVVLAFIRHICLQLLNTSKSLRILDTRGLQVFVDPITTELRLSECCEC